MTAMNIGLIAHDAKKKLMQNFCIAYRGIHQQTQFVWQRKLQEH